MDPFSNPVVSGEAPPLRNPDGSPLQDESGFLLPPYRTFSSIFNTVSRTFPYRWDEALRHSQENAEAMLRDTFIRGCLQERMLQLSELNWHLEPEDERNSQQKQITQELQNVCKATYAWTQFAKQMAWTMWYGRYGNQMDWQVQPVNGQKRLVVGNHSPVNGDKIQFGWDGTPRVYVSYMWIKKNAPHGSPLAACIENMPERDALANPTNEQPVLMGDRAPMLILKDPRWRERFCIAKHDCIDADYFNGEMAGGLHGVGLRSVIYWHYWVRGELVGWAINHLKKIGVGGILIFYYDQGNTAAQLAAENAAKDAGERYALAMPRPIGSSKDVNHAELLSFNESGVTALKDMLESWCERHIERYMIGQTLSSKSDGGGMGDGTASLHADTKYKILKSDARTQEDYLTHDFVRVAHKWNFPRQCDFRVRFVYDIPDPDADTKVKLAQAFYGMNIPFKATNIRGAAGFEKPEKDDEVVSQMEDQKKTMQMQGEAQQQQAQAGAQQQGQQMDAQAQQQDAQRQQMNQQAMQKVQQPDASQPEEDGLPPLTGAAAQMIQMQAADDLLIEYAVTHAPHNMTIAGKQFQGGQFIPSQVMAQATPQEKAALEAGHAVNEAKKTRMQQQGMPPEAAPQAGLGQAPPQEQAGFERPEQVIPEEQMQDMLRHTAGITDKNHLGPVMAAVEKYARMNTKQFASSAGKAYQKAAQAQALGQITEDTYEAVAAKVISKYRFQQTKVISGRAQLAPVSKAMQETAKVTGQIAGSIAKPLVKHGIMHGAQPLMKAVLPRGQYVTAARALKSPVGKEVHKSVAGTLATIIGRLTGRAIANTPHAVHAAKTQFNQMQADAAPVLYRDDRFPSDDHGEIRRALLTMLAEEGAEASPAEVTWMLKELERLFMEHPTPVKTAIPYGDFDEAKHARLHGRFSTRGGHNPDGPDAGLRRRWESYKKALATRGDAMGTGHARIAIPKTNLSEEEIHKLGFIKGLIGIPESGQDSQYNWRHPNHNYHIHSHPDHWFMHEDSHPSLTIALRNAKGVGEKVKAIKAGMSHILGEGAPGLAHYLLSKVRGGRSMTAAISKKAVLRGRAARYQDDADRLADEVLAELGGE